MLELVANPRRQHYRFSAEVAQSGSSLRLSTVGIYCLSSRHRTRGGDDTCCCTLTFNDQPGDARSGQDGPVSQVTFGFWRYRFPNQTNHEPLVEANFSPAQADTLSWRKLEVEVTPTDVAVFWGDTPAAVAPLKTMSRADLITAFRKWKQTPIPPWFNNPELNPQFQPESGLGLWVRAGRGYFRNVILTPLD
jgi:hypothetical protein